MVLVEKNLAQPPGSKSKINVTYLLKLDKTSDYPWRLEAHVPFKIFVNIRKEGGEIKIKIEPSADIRMGLDDYKRNLNDRESIKEITSAIYEKLKGNPEYKNIQLILEKWLRKNNPSIFQRKHL